MNVGISGATGVVGEVALRLLAERRLPVGSLRLFASSRSAGRRITWRDRELTVEALEDADFGGLDLVINSTSSGVARAEVPRMVDAGAVVVDNTSAFRQDPEVPLVIPEINAHAARGHKGIIANPNCTTATVLMALAPLHRAAGIASVISTSFQSVSGTGRDAMGEVLEATRKALDQVDGLRGDEQLDLPDPEVYPHPMAFNVMPQCEQFPEGADTSTEEQKMAAESRKILEDADLTIHATAVRVPVLVGHSVSLSLSLERAVSPPEAREIIGAFPGVALLDEPDKGRYPTPLQAAGRDEVLVGRIRPNPALANGLSLFACGDNLRKGAALNAIQIAELLFAG